MSRKSQFSALLAELNQGVGTHAEEDADYGDPELDDDGLSEKEGAVFRVLKVAAKTVTALSAEVKTLRAEVDALKGGGGQPMRKAIRARGGMSGEEFMAKAMSAQAAGRLTGLQVSIAEAHINNGKAPPASIQQAVLAEGAH